MNLKNLSPVDLREIEKIIRASNNPIKALPVVVKKNGQSKQILQHQLAAHQDQGWSVASASTVGVDSSKKKESVKKEVHKEKAAVPNTFK